MVESADSIVSQLIDIYLGTLARCEPGAVLREAVGSGRVSIPDGCGSIVSVGKCAVPLAKAAAGLTGIANGLVIYPEGYGEEISLLPGLERMAGSHPVPTAASVAAARRAMEFVAERREPVLFLVSGGASACMEDGLAPHVRVEDLVRINELLLASGLAIDAINTVRRHLSAIKGGRLGAIAPRGSTTLVYSDVPPGRPELVGSGPTAQDPTTLGEAAAILRALGMEVSTSLAETLESGGVPETVKEPPTDVKVIADSDALLRAATVECRERGLVARIGPSLDGEVSEVARRVAREASRLGERDVLVMAGEPTVRVSGNGRGGRCTELGARLVLEADAAVEYGICGLFGSSDGRDGSSPAAAVVVHPARGPRLDRDRAAEALGRSASYELVADYGEPIIMMPTGNNLRDVALVFRAR